MMKKLYKKSDDQVHYAEAWVSDGTCTVHWGQLGDEGESKEIEIPDGVSEEAAIDQALAKASSEGFAEIPPEEHATVAIYYKTDHEWGGPQDLERRHAIQGMVDECLGWTGNGHCDGGDIGSGEMSVFCFTVDPVIACQSLVEYLAMEEELEGATMAYRFGDQEEKVIWTPADGKQRMAELDAEYGLADEADEAAQAPPETEQQWRESGNPESLRNAIPKEKLTARRCRLYALACCERIQEFLIHPDAQRALAFGRTLVHGNVDPVELEAVSEAAGEVLSNASMMDYYLEGELHEIQEMEGDVEAVKQFCELAKGYAGPSIIFAHAADSVLNLVDEDPLHSCNAEMSAAWAIAADATERTEESEQRYQADLIRDIFGNPFSSPQMDESWRTQQVKTLALEIDQSGDFSKMANLKSSLQQAGCTEASVLDHCDEPFHTRGCWLVDWCAGF